MGQSLEHLTPVKVRNDVTHIQDAFWDLHTCRSFTMGGYGPIPWLSVHEYAKRRGYRDHEIDDFCFLIREMDNALIGHQSKKAAPG